MSSVQIRVPAKGARIFLSGLREAFGFSVYAPFPIKPPCHSASAFVNCFR